MAPGFLLRFGMADPRLGERALYLLARTLCAVPSSAQLALGGGPITIDGQTLAPELMLLLRATARMDRGLPTGTEIGAYRQAQDRGARVAGGRADKLVTKDVPIGSLRARHYPAADGAPLLVYLHGGGFVFGDLDSHDVPCRLLARHAGVHLLAIEYRLSPEHVYPIAVDDTLAALRWAQENAASLGADPGRVGIGGDSAGGNLAAVIAQMTRDDRPPAAQVLIYPAISRRRAWRSVELFGKDFFLSSDAIEWFFLQYLGADYVRPETPDPRIDPLENPDLGRLAPALVITAGFDPLRDEGEAYGAALRDAGNVAVTRRFPSLLHGFINMAGISAACRDAVVELAGATRMLFGA